MKKVRNASQIRSIISGNMKLSHDQLVLDNMKFALKIAHEYKAYGPPFEDLVQGAYHGLVEAAGKFNRRKGVKFISFAVYYIRMRIRDAVTFYNNPIRQPSSHTRKLRKIKSAMSGDPSMSVRTLSRKTKLKEKAIERVLVSKINGFVSLNQTVSGTNPFSTNGYGSGGNNELEEVLVLPNTTPGPDEATDRRMALEMVLGRISLLSQLERRVIEQRFFGERTLEDIGNEVSRTPAGVKAILSRGLDKIRDGVAS